MRCWWFAVLMAAMPVQAQTPITARQFTPTQKAEWENFQAHWHGNGKGACLPIMENKISAGQCTRFDFSVDLSVSTDGKISTVKVRDNRIRCKDKAVQAELMQCFSRALRDDILDETMRLKGLRNRIVLNASL